MTRPEAEGWLTQFDKTVLAPDLIVDHTWTSHKADQSISVSVHNQGTGRVSHAEYFSADRLATLTPADLRTAIVALAGEVAS